MTMYQGHMKRTWSGTNFTRSNRLEIFDARKNIQDMSLTKQVCAITKEYMFPFAMFGDTNTKRLYMDLT